MGTLSPVEKLTGSRRTYFERISLILRNKQSNAKANLLMNLCNN